MSISLNRSMGRPVAVLLAAVVTGVAFVGGCSDDDPSPSKDADPSIDDGTASDVPAVTTNLTVERVTGKLGTQQKQKMKADVIEVVDRFFDEAYLGDYPRQSFAKAYSAFTAGAKKDAKRDAGLMSNAEIADQIDEAAGTRRRVALDVLAVKGKAQGVTARFTLDFDTTGSLEHSERVKGYLLLDHEDGAWQVFGYSVIRSVIS